MDIQLYYTDTGYGDPLILLHGNGEDQTYFQHQIEFFSKGSRVIAIDTRGHGKSPRGTAPFTIKQFANDLLDFMNDLHIEKADILGFSDGGNIALTFTLDHPERVSRLILNGANLHPKGIKFFVQAPIVLGYHAAKLLGGTSNAEMLGLMVNEPNITPRQLHTLQTPTLVIAGRNDMIKASHTSLIASSLPKSKLAIIEGDHFIANKNSTEFNKIVQKFLNS